MTDDDWAPLSPAELCQRPGERAEPAASALVPSHTTTPPAAPAAAPSPAEQRAAELALAALQTRLARSAPATSLVAAAAHREQKAARKQRARQHTPLGELLVHEDAPAPEVEYAPGPAGRDDREDSEWFRGLPPVEQERLRVAWAAQRARTFVATSRARRIGNRRFVASLFVFAAVAVLGTHALWHATLGAAVVTGLWWRHTAPDRFLDPVRGVACFFALQSLAMVAGGGQNPALFMDAVFVVAFAALVGFDGEMRRSGGFDAT